MIQIIVKGATFYRSTGEPAKGAANFQTVLFRAINSRNTPTGECPGKTATFPLTMASRKTGSETKKAEPQDTRRKNDIHERGMIA